MGMRKVSLGRTERHGHLRPLLNDDFVFQIGFLDQVPLLPMCVASSTSKRRLSVTSRTSSAPASLAGVLLPLLIVPWHTYWNLCALSLQGFWPDGVYTAPTDEALESDIKFTKSLGMNLLRKHIKVRSCCLQAPKLQAWAGNLEEAGWCYWCNMPEPLAQQTCPSCALKGPLARAWLKHLTMSRVCNACMDRFSE